MVGSENEKAQRVGIERVENFEESSLAWPDSTRRVNGHVRRGEKGKQPPPYQRTSRQSGAAEGDAPVIIGLAAPTRIIPNIASV